MKNCDSSYFAHFWQEDYISSYCTLKEGTTESTLFIPDFSDKNLWKFRGFRHSLKCQKFYIAFTICFLLWLTFIHIGTSILLQILGARLAFISKLQHFQKNLHFLLGTTIFQDTVNPHYKGHTMSYCMDWNLGVYLYLTAKRKQTCSEDKRNSSPTFWSSIIKS